jgi:hypothetical protein
VHCAAGTVQSRCVIRGNSIVGASEQLGPYIAGGRSWGQGVVCDGGSCGRVENNVPFVSWSGGGTLSNNCMWTFSESDAVSDPLVFTNNALLWSYLDEGTTSLETADAINALGDVTSSGNVVGACPGGVGPCRIGKPTYELARKLCPARGPAPLDPRATRVSRSRGHAEGIGTSAASPRSQHRASALAVSLRPRGIVACSGGLIRSCYRSSRE